MRQSKKLLPFLLLLTWAITIPVNAQEPSSDVSDDDVNRVARELYCPICENTPLDVCETQACEDWRQLIREKLSAGQSEQQIITYFADIYGERARATPSTEGFSLIVWIAPLVLAAIALIVFVRLLRSWLARGSSPPPSDVRQDEEEPDEYISRLEQEIRESS
jgi:cytochrome c-type biogenesis protein CcmH